MNLSADWATTGPRLVAEMPPKKLYEKFGFPLLNDGDGESMGTYVFVSETGSVVTIYYRANDVLQLLLRLFKKSFWRSNNPCRLTIGANSRSDAEEFSRWLIGVIPCNIGSWPW